MSLGRKIISVELAHDLDSELYDFPLTLRTYFPERWAAVEVTQQGVALEHEIEHDQDGNFVTYNAQPNDEPILITTAER